LARAPEVLLTDGALVDTWQDPRVLAVAAATAYFWWRRGIFGTIVVGTTVMLAARLGHRDIDEPSKSTRRYVLHRELGNSPGNS
jgi:Na+-driven multidrug efflux pump